MMENELVPAVPSCVGRCLLLVVQLAC